jgi:PAS domain S-box-containing protein
MPSQTIEQLYRAFIDESPYGCVIADWSGTFVMVNKKFAEILERTVEETIGLRYEECTPKAYFESDARVMANFADRGYYDWSYKHYILPKGRGFVRVRLYLARIVIDDKKYIWSLVEKISGPQKVPPFGRDEVPEETLGRDEVPEKDLTDEPLSRVKEPQKGDGA